MNIEFSNLFNFTISEGSACELHTGELGVCKNAANCKWLIQNVYIKKRMQLSDIRTCLFAVGKSFLQPIKSYIDQIGKKIVKKLQISTNLFLVNCTNHRLYALYREYSQCGNRFAICIIHSATVITFVCDDFSYTA